jgi:hypothetical protein
MELGEEVCRWLPPGGLACLLVLSLVSVEKGKAACCTPGDPARGKGEAISPSVDALEQTKILEYDPFV